MKTLDDNLKIFEQLEAETEQNEIQLSKIDSHDLSEMVAQSRSLKKFVDNHMSWIELYNRFKVLSDEEINSCEFDIQKALTDSKKFMDAVKNERQAEYDDLLKQIQKLARKVDEDAEGQEKRLVNFENKVIGNDPSNGHISDPDMVFLKKEVARYHGALDTIKANKDEVLADSVAINDKKRDSGDDAIPVSDIQQMKSNLKALEKLLGIEIPRVQRNIDMLDGFSQKSLKNKLNDDNKKSQAMISQMKKNYEDL